MVTGSSRVLAGAEGDGGDCLGRGTKELFRLVEMFSILIVMVVTKYMKL